MTLGYSKQFPDGKPTNFREKIWEGFYQHRINGTIPDAVKAEYDKYLPGSLHPKIHSMREDPNDRWPPATGVIHHCYDNRSKTRQCFAESKCHGIQRVQILWTDITGVDDKGRERVIKQSQMVLVDGQNIHGDQLEQLALNDGFESVDHFFSWFNRDFSGKIIHFTKLRYFNG